MEIEDIYQYLNYREFIKEYLADLKSRDSKISHRYILSKMDISSTGFLANVISGKKNLSNAQVLKFCKVLKFPKPETRFMETLVLYNQSKDLAEKTEYYQRLLALQKVEERKLKEKEFNVFANWYYIAILELLYFYEFKGDYSELSKQLNPPIKTSQAKQAIEDLAELGMIEQNDEGVYVQCPDKTLSTGEEVRSLQVQNFQDVYHGFSQGSTKAFSIFRERHFHHDINVV